MEQKLPLTLRKTPLGIAIFIILLMNISNAFAATIYSQGSGDWSNASTWSGTISDGDIVIIQAGDIVTVNGNIYNGSPLNLQVTIDGGLIFANGKLNLHEDAIVTINTGGYLDSDADNNDNSEKLKIGNGDAVWSGKDGRVGGPYQFSRGGGSSVLPVIAVLKLQADRNEEKEIILSWVNEVIDGTPSSLVIQGSFDGRHFTDISLIESNSFSGPQEAVLDQTAYTYFRIGIIDENRHRNYSATASLDNDSSLTSQVFPNPVNGNQLFLTGKNITEANLRKGTGIIVHHFDNSFFEDFNELSIPADLPNGVYYLNVGSESGIQSFIICIQR